MDLADLGKARNALRGLLDYYFYDTRKRVQFSIPPQDDDTDLLLERVLNDFERLLSEYTQLQVKYGSILAAANTVWSVLIQAGRIGAEQDIPEGHRYIQISDTLVEDLCELLLNGVPPERRGVTPHSSEDEAA